MCRTDRAGLGGAWEIRLEFVSCVPTVLYRGGGFYDDAASLARLSDPGYTRPIDARLLTQVFPPFDYIRRKPLRVVGGDPASITALDLQMDSVNATRRHGAASALVCIENGFLHCNVLYSRSATGVRVVYETLRANDRPYVPLIDPLTSDYSHEPLSDAQVVDVFLGSPGTANYGHWLIDDLPRTAGLGTLRAEAGSRPIRIWISDAGEAMNTVRIESIDRVCIPFGPVEVRVARLDCIFDFKRLHYVTPVSYHPVLKSPDAIRWLAEHFTGGAPSLKLFVTRRTNRGRELVNSDAVRTKLEAIGFQTVETDGMSFGEQTELFARALIVVGCMGASMTNCVFAPPGAKLLYLAPAGWLEPFYWDLAAVCGHDYSVLFGVPTSRGVVAHMAPFSIDTSELDHSLDALVT